MNKTDEILEKLYEEGSFEGEHRDIHPDRIVETKQALLELIKSVEPKRYINEYPESKGYSDAISEYSKAIEELFI